MRGRAVNPRKAARKRRVREAHTWMHTKWHLVSGVTLTLIAWQWRHDVGLRLQHEFELHGSTRGIVSSLVLLVYVRWRIECFR